MNGSIRNIPDREIAMALVSALAQTETHTFALLGYYDDDCDFVHTVADRLGVKQDDAFYNKLTKVTRHLVRYGVLQAKMRGTDKQYIGEPSKQMNYSLPAGKAGLLTKGETDYTMSPEGEAAFLLYYAYPKPEEEEDL